jgi:uncharacterized protein
MAITFDAGTNPRLAEAVQCLVESFSPERIYLFGSQARGEATEDSDYDLLMVVSWTDERAVKRMARARGVVSHIKIPAEIIVLTTEQFERQAPVVTSLAATVLREGRLLYAAE